jgi:DNA/RNA-binding domain of Phe-tRNA-synthetase-like protein
MHFQHSGDIWRDFPILVPGVLYAEGITSDVADDSRAGQFAAVARARLAAVSAEGELPEIQAWRRAFTKMGLKPTQYRCASESLLRRFRKEGNLPRLHPLVDLCNAVSLAFAVPVAVFDVAAVTGSLEVRYAAGNEDYLTFAGHLEHPAAREVIFADLAGRAHARRWTNRQSGASAVRDSTTRALIVAEALHDSAPEDICQLTDALGTEIKATWGVTPSAAVLTAASPRFTFAALRERPGGLTGATRPSLRRDRRPRPASRTARAASWRARAARSAKPPPRRPRSPAAAGWRG